MARSVYFLVATEALAVVVTMGTIGLQIKSSAQAAQMSAVRTSCSVAAALQLVVLLILAVVGTSQALRAKWLSWTYSSAAFALQLFSCVAAVTASAVGLAYVGMWTFQAHDYDAEYHNRRNMFVGLAVAVTVGTALQLSSFICCYFLSRMQECSSSASSSSMHSGEDCRKFRVKSIRYSDTYTKRPTQEMRSVRSNVSSIAVSESSSMGSFGSPRASLAQGIRESSSRTRLLAHSDRPQTASRDSFPPRLSDDTTTFDSWDTSCVDAHNRQVVMDMSSPSGTGSSPGTKRSHLETIPASPSGSPSRSRASSRPGTPLDFDPGPRPRMVRKSHSYTSEMRSSPPDLDPPSPTSELHIHPLFRSDSPVPPPAVTPGTSVVAAPDAARVISHQHSYQSLRRLRSGSLPAGRSPLTHQMSLDSLMQNRLRDAAKPRPSTSFGEQRRARRDTSNGSVRPSTSSGESSGTTTPLSERTITPPVPEWLLSPSMKANLEAYSKDGPGEDA